MLIVDMKMPKRCFDCPMHDWTYGQHETRQNVLVCNARHELTPILCQTIPNGDERPDWCPIQFRIEEIEPLSISACNDKVVLIVTCVNVMKEENDEQSNS